MLISMAIIAPHVANGRKWGQLSEYRILCSVLLKSCYMHFFLFTNLRIWRSEISLMCFCPLVYSPKVSQKHHHFIECLIEDFLCSYIRFLFIVWFSCSRNKSNQITDEVRFIEHSVVRIRHSFSIFYFMY